MYSYQLTQTIGRRRCSKDKWDLNRRSLTSKVTALPLSHNSCCATNNCTNYEFSTIHISWPSFLSFSEAFPYGVKFTLFFTFPSDDRSRDTLTQILKCRLEKWGKWGRVISGLMDWKSNDCFTGIDINDFNVIFSSYSYVSDDSVAVWPHAGIKRSQFFSNVAKK